MLLIGVMTIYEKDMMYSDLADEAELVRRIEKRLKDNVNDSNIGDKAKKILLENVEYLAKEAYMNKLKFKEADYKLKMIKGYVK